jgi:hypothetical protein
VGGVHCIDFDSTQKDPGAAKSLESQHGSRASFDRSMVLLDEIVEVFELTDFDGHFTIGLAPA